MRPWELPIPPVLYKYLQPDRVEVLNQCRVRFSQRTVFDDERELRPEFASFGTEGEIWSFVIAQGFQLDQRIPPNVLVKLIAVNPKYQKLALKVAEGAMTSPEEFGILCLTESADCEGMWMDYADNRRGFVLAFDTTHTGFGVLKAPGRFGRVSYSDVPFETFLGTMDNEGPATFFRKRMKYAFEMEWRGIRALHRLERFSDDVFLSRFDPASVCEIIIRPGCLVETALREMVQADGRYRHAAIRVIRL
jgi:hypothetical protein